jgi:hypothetical protein
MAAAGLLTFQISTEKCFRYEGIICWMWIFENGEMRDVSNLIGLEESEHNVALLQQKKA